MSINPGITVGSSTFADLVYADDTALLLPSATDATTSLKSFSGHVAGVNDTLLYSVYFTYFTLPAKMALQLHITYHSADLLTARGVAHLVVHGTDGSTSYETITPVRLETSRRAVDCGRVGATT